MLRKIQKMTFLSPLWWPNREVISASFLILVGLIIRILSISSRGMWYDEIHSVVFASLPFADLLKSVQIYDAHPPVYYMQLAIWMLGDTSDTWLKLNSIFWSMLTTGSVFIVGRKLYGGKTALIGLGLFAIFPMAVVYAQEVRMYSMLMFLAIWGLFFTHQYCEGKQRVRACIGMLLCVEGSLYSHGAGFMLLLSLNSYALLYFIQHRVSAKTTYLQWFGLQGVICISYLPWLIHAQSIVVTHTRVPTLENIVNTLFILFFGFGRSYPVWIQWVGTVFVLSLIAAAFQCEKNIRLTIVSFVVIPILFCIGFSYFVRSIWLFRTFAYIAPILCLLLATIIAAWGNTIQGSKKAWGMLGLGVVVWMGALIWQQQTYFYPEDFKQAVELLRMKVGKGEVIQVPGERVFWGISWYYVGSKSVNPITTNYILTTPTNVIVNSETELERLVREGEYYWNVQRSAHPSTRPDTVAKVGNLVIGYSQRK